MSVITLFELHVKAESVAVAREIMGHALKETRAFDGSLGVDVLVADDDAGHWVIYERWETLAHDAAYQAFRDGEGAVVGFGELLAGPPGKTRYTIADF
jgi:quinol monooxygenase YgiN